MSILLGKTILILNDRPFTDLADSDNIKTDRPNNVGDVLAGEGGTMALFDVQGLTGELTIRLLEGSRDDRFLNVLADEMTRREHKFINGTFIKPVNDGTDINSISHDLQEGQIIKFPSPLNSASNNVDSVVSEWILKFGKVTVANYR